MWKEVAVLSMFIAAAEGSTVPAIEDSKCHTRRSDCVVVTGQHVDFDVDRH
jgi:hypothetical protein